MKKVFFIAIIGVFTMAACKSTGNIVDAASSKTTSTQKAKNADSSSNSKKGSDAGGSSTVSNPNGLATKPAGGTQSTPIKKSPPGTN